MNEQIVKLSREAGDFATETYSKYTMATFFTNKSIETLFEEKLTELIVRECAKISDATPAQGSILPKLLRHFGVEQE